MVFFSSEDKGYKREQAVKACFFICGVLCNMGVEEKTDIDLYRRTLALWGEQAQYDQMIEECAELSVALLHYRRDKGGSAAVIDEMADVILMLGQLRWMFGADQVDQAVERKRSKLENMLACAGVEKEGT